MSICWAHHADYGLTTAAYKIDWHNGIAVQRPLLWNVSSHSIWLDILASSQYRVNHRYYGLMASAPSIKAHTQLKLKQKHAITIQVQVVLQVKYFQ